MSDFIVGVDVSAHQPPEKIDWKALHKQGVRFAIIKAAEGVGDNTYRAGEHANKAVAAGVHVGYYSFARPRTAAKYEAEREIGPGWEATALAQGRQLVDNVKDLPFPSMGLWLDLEVNDDQMDPTTLAAWSETFLSVLSDARYATGIYAGYYFLKENVAPTETLAEQPLWIPWYHGAATGPRRTPPLWKDWAIHQWTDKGRLDGYDGPLDLNVAQPSAYRRILLRSRLQRLPKLLRWAFDR